MRYRLKPKHAVTPSAVPFCIMLGSKAVGEVTPHPHYDGTIFWLASMGLGRSMAWATGAGDTPAQAVDKAIRQKFDELTADLASLAALAERLGMIDDEQAQDITEAAKQILADAFPGAGVLAAAPASTLPADFVDTDFDGQG